MSFFVVHLVLNVCFVVCYLCVWLFMENEDKIEFGCRGS
jgi:phage shock protein PspC (stress-responsive transcriptional regulator)